jgi:hypothetical protein
LKLPLHWAVRRIVPAEHDAQNKDNYDPKKYGIKDHRLLLIAAMNRNGKTSSAIDAAMMRDMVW